MTSLLRGIAYITGAGSGIGQATAYSMARHGVRSLALTDLHASRLQETIAGLKTLAPDVEVLPLPMDVSREADVDASIAETVARFGGIDFAVNNAGRGGAMKETAELSLEDWRSLIEVNLTGVWLCQRAQIRQMLRQPKRTPRLGRGSIVNISSMLGTVASAPTSKATDYTSTKHGVLGLTKADAIYYGAPAFGIRINAVCPGYVGTPMLLEAQERGLIDGEIQKVPLRRLALPEEVADVVVFLSAEMGSFVCGQGVLVDGGYTC